MYFGSVDDAKRLWIAYKGEEVFITPKAYDFEFDDKTLIRADAYSTKYTWIDDLNLYLQNTESDVSIEDALNIARSYLPMDLIRQYYQFEDSYILDMKENKVHIVSYIITEEGNAVREENYKKSELSVYDMPYQIYVWLWGEDNSIGTLRINNDMDNAYWESNYSRNGIEREEWHYDFLE